MRPPSSLLCSTLLPSMLRHAPEYLAMIFHDVRWAEPNHDVSATLHPNGSWHRQWWAAYFCEASHMAAKAGNCMYLLTDALPCFLHLVWHDLTLRRNCQRWPLSALSLGMHGIQKLKVKDRKSAITVFFYFYGLLLLLLLLVLVVLVLVLLLLLLWLLPLWRSPLDIMDFRASHQGFFLLSGGLGVLPDKLGKELHATWGLRSTPCRAGWNAEEHQPLYRRHQLWWVLAGTSCSTSFYLSDQETHEALFCLVRVLRWKNGCFSWKVQRCDAVCEPKTDLTSWLHHASPWGPGGSSTIFQGWAAMSSRELLSTRTSTTWARLAC